MATALAAGVTVRQAATDAKVGESTIFRWLQDSAYRAEVAALRSSMVSDALGALSATMGESAATLKTLLNDTDPNVRLRAACQIITLGMRMREQVEIEDRVRELEDRMDAVKK